VNQPLNIVILGGGTAGWMAAAGLISLVSPKLCRIRLIESDEIGTVGVGEATLPHLKNFNDTIGLDEAEMVRNTRATFKLGIQFSDWGFQGSRYIHPFGTYGRATSGSGFHQRWLRARAAGCDWDIGDFSYAIVAARRNRFDFPDTRNAGVSSTYSYAYHLDASVYAGELRKLAESREQLRLLGIGMRDQHCVPGRQGGNRCDQRAPAHPKAVAADQRVRDARVVGERGGTAQHDARGSDRRHEIPHDRAGPLIPVDDSIDDHAALVRPDQCVGDGAAVEVPEREGDPCARRCRFDQRDGVVLQREILGAGGPRILNDLSKFLGVDGSMLRHSWATLTEYGNIASAVVLDALGRLFDEGTMTPGATGVIAGFGPGITAEMAMGTWTVAPAAVESRLVHAVGGRV